MVGLLAESTMNQSLCSSDTQDLSISVRGADHGAGLPLQHHHCSDFLLEGYQDHEGPETLLVQLLILKKKDGL